MKKMGYFGRGPLGRGMGIIEPLEAPFRPNKLKTGVGYSEQEYEGLPFYSSPSPLDKKHHKHGDIPSSTLTWLPKERNTITHKVSTSESMDVLPLDLHLKDEFLPTTVGDKDNDDSTKWKFDSLSKESTHDK